MAGGPQPLAAGSLQVPQVWFGVTGDDKVEPPGDRERGCGAPYCLGPEKAGLRYQAE